MRPARLLAAALAALALSAGPAVAWAAQSSVEALSAQLGSSDPRVRREAVRALADDRSEAAVASLGQVASDSDREVRRVAIDALTALRRPDAAPVLVGFLEDEERDHRRKVVSGLVAIYRAEAPPGFSTRAVNWLMRREAEFVLDPLRPVDPAIVEAVVGRLGDEDDEVRRRAAVGLGALRQESTAAALAHAASNDPEDRVAREAVRSLGELGTDAAGALLLGFVEEDRVREEALAALGRFAYAPAIPRLIQIYDHDPGNSNGRAALAALARAGAPLARGTFYHELRNRDARRRASAAAGLGRLDDASLADGLIRDFLREDDRRVQLAFCFALVRLGETPFIDRLVLSLADSDRAPEARDYLLELGPGVINQLAAYLDDPDPELRLALIAVLERLGDPAAVAALSGAAESADDRTASRARLAIRRLQASPTPDVGS